MADAVLSYTIAEAKVDEYISDYVYVHKNTELNDPEDPDSGLKYTDKQWVREHIMRSVKAQIVRGKNAKYRDDKSSYNADDVTQEGTMGKNEELYGTLMIQAEIIQGKINDVKRKIVEEMQKPPAPKVEPKKE